MQIDNLHVTGVYKITNTINGKIYIGSTARTHKMKCMRGFYRRFEHHKQGLRKNYHSNKHLQNSWNKYGENSFVFEILATCPPEYCIKLEQWFIDSLKPAYNIRQRAESNLGIKQTAEHIKKRVESYIEGYYTNSERRLRSAQVKLTEDQVREIKVLLSAKVSLRKCAKKFNVGLTTIHQISSGRTWKDIRT